MSKKKSASAKKPAQKPAKGNTSASRSKLYIWIGVAVIVVAVAILVLRPAAGGVDNIDSAKVENIDATKLEELANGGVRVVDVRSAGEYAQAHVPGALNVPYTEIGVVAASWNRDEPIAVYCLTGARSSSAVQTLTSLGFTKIYHFDAGFQAWRGPVEEGSGTAVSEIAPPKVSGPVMYEFYSDG